MWALQLLSSVGTAARNAVIIVGTLNKYVP
jgi:hypothetical protein